MGWELLKNKGGSISFQNPFLLCPSSLWLDIRTQSVLGTCFTNFYFRFLLHRINYCIVVFEYFFINYCWLNMTKTAWNCKIWWNSEPEGQHDPDWTQMWTLGAWPNPISGFNLGLCLRFHLDPEIGPLFWSYQPIFGPKGLIPTQFGSSGWALRVLNWVRVGPQGRKLGWYDQKIRPNSGSS